MPTTSSSPSVPYLGPVGYPPGFYGQYPGPPGPKPGEGHTYYPQFYLAPVHPPTGAGQDSDNVGYPPSQPQFYPTTFLTPYTQPYPPYVMHPRPESQIPLPSNSYNPYSQMYQKPHSTGGSGVDAVVLSMGSRRDGHSEGDKDGEGLMDLHDKSG
jgi:hypothetical protein